eukprot:5034735-Prymnesium_polylepis.1
MKVQRFAGRAVRVSGWGPLALHAVYSCTCMILDCVFCLVNSRVRLEHVCIAHGTALDSRLPC